MGVVGKNVMRLDGRDKVTGKAKYVDDISLPDMWHGVAVRSTIPAGRVLSVKFDPSFNWKKVVVADRHDIPGRNVVTMIEEDLPLLVHDDMKHIGEAILLIAAPTKKMAEDACRHIHIEYEEWEPVLSIEDSKSKRRIVHGSDNVIAQYKVKRGDLNRGFKDAHHIIEGTYRTGAQEHTYIETNGMIAIPRRDGGVDLIGSLQCPYYILKAMERLLGMQTSKISVAQATIGGAFGGKEDYPSVLAGYVSVLALKAKRPIKMIYDRREDMIVTTKRHPAIVRHKTGVKKDGTLVAMEIEVEFDAGAYVTLTPVVLSRGLLHSTGPYRCPHVKATGIAYATNTAPNGAFRGFGVPQTIFAIEAHMDRIAVALNISPLEMRRKNCFREGDEIATGQILKESVGAIECLEKAAAASDFERKWREYRNANPPHPPFLKGGGSAQFPPLSKGGEGGFSATSAISAVKRGIGLSLFHHGAGFTGSGEAKMKGKAGLRLEKDGKLTVLTGCTDMGQGAHTVLPQIVADTLGVPLDFVQVEMPNTAKVPDSGPTVASRTTTIIGRVLAVCAEELKRELFEFAEEQYGVDRTKLKIVDGVIYNGERKHGDLKSLAKFILKKRGPITIIEAYEPPAGIHWDDAAYRGDAYAAYAWACDVAEVEVDLNTFEVRVDKMWMVQDVGRAINPQMVEGQIEGGTLQAVGYALMEDHRYDRGRLLNNRLQTYIIPTALDTPDFETTIVEKPYSHGPMGAKGLGELPMDGGAPAIINAIANATGLRIDDLPATPEKLFEEWKKHSPPL